jgi:hypothetical protein
LIHLAVKKFMWRHPLYCICSTCSSLQLTLICWFSVSAIFQLTPIQTSVAVSHAVTIKESPVRTNCVEISPPFVLFFTMYSEENNHPESLSPCLQCGGSSLYWLQ